MKEKDGGHGCRTQVRLEHLRGDGLHLQPRFFYVLQQTYAYACMEKYAPDPTPLESFTPDYARQAYQREWPLLNRVGGDMRASYVTNGWRR